MNYYSFLYFGLPMLVVVSCFQGFASLPRIRNFATTFPFSNGRMPPNLTDPAPGWVVGRQKDFLLLCGPNHQRASSFSRSNQQQGRPSWPSNFKRPWRRAQGRRREVFWASGWVSGESRIGGQEKRKSFSIERK